MPKPRLLLITEPPPLLPFTRATILSPGAVEIPGPPEAIDIVVVVGTTPPGEVSVPVGGATVIVGRLLFSISV